MTYVILSATKNLTNYAPITDKVVFHNAEYAPYNVSQYTLP